MKEFFARSEVVLHDIIVYLKEYGTMSEDEIYFFDNEGDGFEADLGYLIDNLYELESYFARKKRGEK